MSRHSVVQPAPSPPAYPRESYAWYVIAILFLVTVLSQMDRQLPTLLVAPIRAEFGISDTAFSILQGYAFAIVYTLAGIPLGRLVDRTHRRNLILAGLLFWSAMTVFSGLSTTYSQLFVARMGIGIGEAVLAPAAYSIIADYIAPARRGRALAVYYMSIGIGSGASLFIGGLILQALPSEDFEGPLFGHMDNWRWMFIFAGVPGFLVALDAVLRPHVDPQREVERERGVDAFLLQRRDEVVQLGEQGLADRRGIAGGSVELRWQTRSRTAMPTMAASQYQPGL